MKTYNVRECPHCGNPFYLASDRQGEFEAHKRNCKSKTLPKPIKGTFQRNARRKEHHAG